MKGAAVLALPALLVSACGPSSSSPSLQFRTPQALIACAAPPADLQARLWVSGSAEFCPLDVDLEAGTTTGSCEATPGIVRRFTLDWFIDVGGREIVLAQAQRDVDLAGQQQAVELQFAPADVDNVECFDMSVNSFEGSPVVDVDGVDQAVCDLDADGADNLTELCGGQDPLGGP